MFSRVAANDDDTPSDSSRARSPARRPARSFTHLILGRCRPRLLSIVPRTPRRARLRSRTLIVHPLVRTGHRRAPVNRLATDRPRIQTRSVIDRALIFDIATCSRRRVRGCRPRARSGEDGRRAELTVHPSSIVPSTSPSLRPSLSSAAILMQLRPLLLLRPVISSPVLSRRRSLRRVSGAQASEDVVRLGCLIPAVVDGHPLARRQSQTAQRQAQNSKSTFISVHILTGLTSLCSRPAYAPAPDFTPPSPSLQATRSRPPSPSPTHPIQPSTSDSTHQPTYIPPDESPMPDLLSTLLTRHLTLSLAPPPPHLDPSRPPSRRTEEILRIRRALNRTVAQRDRWQSVLDKAERAKEELVERRRREIAVAEEEEGKGVVVVVSEEDIKCALRVVGVMARAEEAEREARSVSFLFSRPSTALRRCRSAHFLLLYPYPRQIVSIPTTTLLARTTLRLLLRRPFPRHARPDTLGHPLNMQCSALWRQSMLLLPARSRVGWTPRIGGPTRDGRFRLELREGDGERSRGGRYVVLAAPQTECRPPGACIPYP